MASGSHDELWRVTISRNVVLQSKTYTVAQLEAMNLWQKMDGKIAVLGGAEVLNAVNDEAQLEKETDGKGRKIRKSLIPIQISRIQVSISQKKSQFITPQ